ncbi:MAG: ribonuclease III [Oscillospiraceae bacterium]|nr:ribonuclease III [Oscillospiraceae bacterium]
MLTDPLQTPLSPDAAKQYSPLALAFLGDSVYEVMVREMLLREGNRPARELHSLAVAHVRAAYQAAAAGRIAEMLTPDEADILRRGRNASGISVPKHATPADYRKATGFECLFGYLYLCGQTERLHSLFAVIWAEGSQENESAE